MNNPTQAQIRAFAKLLPLHQFATVEPVEFELYGTRTWVLDTAKLGKAFQARRFDSGFAQTVELLEARVEALNYL